MNDQPAEVRATLEAQARAIIEAQARPIIEAQAKAAFDAAALNVTRAARRGNTAQWVGAIFAAVTAVTAIVGVGFAIKELNNWTADRDQQRRKMAFEQLSRLNHEPVKGAVEFVNNIRASVWQAGMPFIPTKPNVSEAEFKTGAEPLVAFFDDLELCLGLDECDRVSIAARACSILQNYHFAWIETRGVSPTQPNAKWRSVPASELFDICPPVRDALSKFYEFTAAQGEP